MRKREMDSQKAESAKSGMTTKKEQKRGKKKDLSRKLIVEMNKDGEMREDGETER